MSTTLSPSTRLKKLIYKKEKDVTQPDKNRSEELHFAFCYGTVFVRPLEKCVRPICFIALYLSPMFVSYINIELSQ